jgi:hypothetical protein
MFHKMINCGQVMLNLSAMLNDCFLILGKEETSLGLFPRGLETPDTFIARLLEFLAISMVSQLCFMEVPRGLKIIGVSQVFI